MSQDVPVHFADAMPTQHSVGLEAGEVVVPTSYQQKEELDQASLEPRFLAEITWGDAPSWLRSDIESRIASYITNQRSGMTVAKVSYPPQSRPTRYSSSFCIDTCGTDDLLRNTLRYEVVNKIPLPSRPLESQACFNCGKGGHSVRDCPHSAEPEIIRENVRIFKASQSSSRSESTTSSRYYHERPLPGSQPPSKHPRYPSNSRGGGRTYEDRRDIVDERRSITASYERRDRETPSDRWTTYSSQSYAAERYSGPHSSSRVENQRIIYRPREG